MELFVLNESLEAILLLDSYESLIWTERYYECGDFEIHSVVNDHLLSSLKQDYYLCTNQSDTVMVIEQREIESDAENGSKLIISGRSLESILDRRIVWNQTTLSGSLQEGIKKLLDENIISPAIATRQIKNFIFEPSTNPDIEALTVDLQLRGETLYEVIQSLCETNRIGFKIYLNEHNQFVFTLYKGVDRSYLQDENPYIVFSPTFENIINSNYLESKKTLKTVALILGKSEETEEKTMVAESKSGGTGINRREIFIDGGGVSDTVDDVKLTDVEYENLLLEKGKEELSKNIETRTFEGEVESTIMFRYGEDFHKGDIVQVVNEYGVEARTRIVEFVTSLDESGMDTYPTFETVDYSEYDGSIDLDSSRTIVEYLETDGSQYIDTGFVPNQNTRIDICFETDSVNNTCLAGCYGGIEIHATSVVRNSETCSLVSHGVGQAVISLNKNVLTQNGSSVKKFSSSSFAGNDSIYICALNSGNTASSFAKMKLYSCKIYDDGRLVRDFVPARDIDGVLCLFDNISETYFYNKGTGEFDGPEKGHTEVSFIKATGTQYIDTGFIPNKDTRVVTSVEFKISEERQSSNMKCLFGAYYYNGSSDRGQYYFSTWSGNYWCDYWRNGLGFDESVSHTGRFTIDMNKNKVSITGGGERTAGYYDFPMPITMAIFAKNQLYKGVNTITGFSEAKLYYMKIYDNGTLVRNFIPVIDANGVACLYDRLNHRYYRNAGTGNFITP